MSTPKKTAIQALSGPDRNTYTAIVAILKSWGIESLASTVLKYVQDGYDGPTISVLLPETKEYKKRFAGNEARMKAGLPVLSPAEYIATEDAYRQAARAAGLPKGFYDQTSDFTKFISADVSPTEFNQRVQLAQNEIYNAPPEQVALLKKWYPELSTGDLTAHLLDPKTALPLLQNKINAANIGTAAQHAGVGIDAATASDLVKNGVTQSQAIGGFQTVADFDHTLGNLGAIYGQDYGSTDAEAEVFGLKGSTQAEQKRKGLLSQERAAFGGSGGLGQAGLSQKTSG